MQDIWMSQVQAAYNAKDGASMATLFDPSGQQVSFHAFRATLQALPNFREGTFSSLAKSFFQDQKPIADFLASYLVFVRGFQAQTDDPANAAANYRLLEDCFKMADRVFSMQDVGWFILTMRKFFQALVNLALHAGRVAGDVSLTKAGEAARMLGRPMAMAATDRSTASPTKRDVIFCVANATFKVYFALKNLRLCETVLNSTQIAINNLDKKFPKSDRCAFYYYRGRFALYQRRLPAAYQDLSKAFELCHVNCKSNGRAILTYLVAAALPLGIFPSEDLLIEFDLAEQYADLLPPLQLGDYRSVRAELDRLQPWHMSKGNYSLLCERLQVVCWRNVIRRTLFVVTNSSPIPPSGPPTLDLHCVVTTARLAFEDDTIDMDDVECICASLIDQGLLKAYVLHSKKLLVLQKGPLVGFPPIASVVLPNTTH